MLFFLYALENLTDKTDVLFYFLNNYLVLSLETIYFNQKAWI